MKTYFLIITKIIRTLLASFYEQLHRYYPDIFTNDLEYNHFIKHRHFREAIKIQKVFPYPTFWDGKAFK